MKTKLFGVIASGTAAAVLCLTGMCLLQPAQAQTESASAPVADASVVPAAPDESAALPPEIDPASPLGQIIKLVQAGVSEDVIMAYVTNSSSTFNLDPDKIIYLKDIGAPDELVTAMMQRDEVLKAQLAATGYTPPPTAPATEPAVVETTEPTPPPVVSVDYFYTSLAPYGSWVDVEGYGRCWRPTVTVADTGWQPYCDHGHWIWTDDGWFWMSDYSWGWAPFHYGRWFHQARFGWCWAPDTVWGPSWVTWRYATDYCGWAPLPPNCVYRNGVGFVYNGVTVGMNFDFGLGVNAFTFVPTRNFCDPHPRRHRLGEREAPRVFNRTTVINDFNEDREHRSFINRGIDPSRIMAVTHAEIHPVAIRETTARIPRGEQLARDGRTLMVNRPRFNGNPPPNRGGLPQVAPPPRMIGSPYQPARNGNENLNSPPARRYQPAQPAPGVGSPYPPGRGGNASTFSPPPGRNPSTPPTPAPRLEQRPMAPVTASGPPGRGGVTPPFGRSPSADNRFTPGTPVQPPPPNFFNSTDNRRYPSPRMEQTEPQTPRANPGNPPGANRFSPPAESRQRNYGAPVTAPPPPVRPLSPAETPQRIYVSPRNQTPPGEPRPSYAGPPANNQSRASSAPSSPPAQSRGQSQSSQGQGSGRGRNQNGQ